MLGGARRAGSAGGLGERERLRFFSLAFFLVRRSGVFEVATRLAVSQSLYYGLLYIMSDFTVFVFYITNRPKDLSINQLKLLYITDVALPPQTTSPK